MVLSFVPLVLNRFDVSLSEMQPFPGYQESKPAIGITAGDGDLLINLRERGFSARNVNVD